MRSLFFGLSFLMISSFPHFSQAGVSAVADAGIEASRDFEATFGLQGEKDFVGLRATVDGSGVAVRIYRALGQGLSKSVYTCAAGRCSAIGEENVPGFRPGPRSFALRDVRAGVLAGLETLAARGVRPEGIQELKLWQNGRNLEFRAKPPGAKDAFAMCHFHDGTDLDCHGQSRPGKNEPPE